ncbi:CoA transferase [Micrococcus sp. NPDC078436]|uniref:CaiB/BaiF CoA transferase family protein n=1 Tax=Micrococcus sp. NPDC078436 TaxID=3154960 RepID=UPI0034501CFC
MNALDPGRPGERRPLDGVVVADFSRVLAGPYATMLLADMGATVIKVESPAGDDTRLWMPPERDGIGTYYLSVNRNKHSIVLDFSDEEDLATAYAILDRADVLVENFKPGGLKRFGLDAETVAHRWPQLIHTTITGFGTAGGASMPGYDLLVQGMSGFMHVTGHPDGDPQRAGVAIFDVVTGLHAAVGILAALVERGRNADAGGQHVELNLLSSALSGLVNQTTGYAAAGNNPQRLGNDHPSLYPYGPFPTAERDLIICVGNESQFSRLTACLGLPELAADPRFRSVRLRNENRDELRALMVEALAGHDADHWFAALQSVGVPCAPILDIADGVERAADLGLEPVVQVGSPETRQVPLIRNPVSFSRTPVAYPKAPPHLGEDDDAVRSWLATTPARAARLATAGPRTEGEA